MWVPEVPEILAESPSGPRGSEAQVILLLRAFGVRHPRIPLQARGQVPWWISPTLESATGISSGHTGVGTYQKGWYPY